MGPRIFTVVFGLVGFYLIASLVAELQISRTTASPGAIPLTPHALKPADDDFEVALQQAWQCRTRVRLAAARELEAIEAWDPNVATAAVGQLRQEFLAGDANGDLRQSQALARLAAKRARTPRERYRAAALLARIECDRGDHDAERRWAEVLMALAPGEERSRQELRHARLCLGLGP